MKNRLGNQSGFSLIELVVASTLLAIAGTSVVTVFVAVTNLNRQARNLTIATQKAQEKIEVYRNTSFNTISTGTTSFTGELPAELRSPKSGTIEVTDVEPDLKRIDITLTYNENRTKTVKLTTYATRRGLNR
jgi:prepilin-type N-terminal cleavage/methylation domain-containing protein